jgi:alpha-L-rhamnosidase
MLEHGATTLWEHWEYSDNVYSHNHPMFGSVSEWFYKGLAGINPAPDAVGFDKIIIAPHPIGDLTMVKAVYESARGQIISDWKKDNTNFSLQVRIPAGTSAKIVLPARSDRPVTEGGRTLEHAPGVRFAHVTRESTIIDINSGDYKFSSTLP